MVSKQSQVMAQVTYQALFRSFPKLCGMTGTALTDANELQATYGLPVVQVAIEEFFGQKCVSKMSQDCCGRILLHARVHSSLRKKTVLSTFSLDSPPPPPLP